MRFHDTRGCPLVVAIWPPCLGLLLCIAGCATAGHSIDAELASVQAQQQAANERLDKTLDLIRQAEARQAVAAQEAGAAECRAQAQKIAAEASAAIAACAGRHAHAAQCRANASKATADNTLVGCMLGIGAAALTGGGAAPLAMAGCGIGRAVDSGEDACSIETCQVSPGSAWRVALARHQIEDLPMCGGAMRAQLADAPANGLRPRDVVKGSTADRMGIAPGDVLLTVGGRPTADSAALAAVLGEVPEGSELVATVWRDHQVHEVSAVHGGDKLGIVGAEAASVPSGSVVVAAVERDGAAAEAGLNAGDELWTVNGVLVTDLESARRAIRVEPTGTSVKVEYRRGGLAGQATVVLGPRSDEQAY